MENSFKTLLEKAKTAGLISESESDTMLDQFNGYVNQQSEIASGAAFKDGYEQGYSNAKAQCDQETKQALDDLLAKCDDEAAQKLQTVIETLNDDHANKLQEVYDLLQATMVPVSEMEAMDADHAEKLQTAMECKDKQIKKVVAECEKKLSCESAKVDALKKQLVDMDNDHAKKFKIALECKDREIQKAIEEGKKNVKGEKENKLSALCENVEKYLNYALQEAIPSRKLISEAKYNAAIKSLDKIGSILKINSVIQESRDGVFQDYENKISEAKKQSNQLMMENAELKLQLKKKEAKCLLESKTARCTPAEAAFLKSYFANATSPNTIEEQIDEARSAYKRLHEEKRTNTVKATVAPTRLVSESNTKSVSRNRSEEERAANKKATVVTESAKMSENQMLMDVYANMFKNHN